MSVLPYEVLLVEDDDDDAELTIRALKRRSFANAIRRFHDGAEALDFFFDRPTMPGSSTLPRLVLLDLRLPKIGGLEVLARLRGDERTEKLPVIVLTGSRDDRDLAEAYRLGASSYIVKPVEFDTFAQAIEMLGMHWMLVNQPQS
jgi:two-component system response regulator